MPFPRLPGSRLDALWLPLVLLGCSRSEPADLASLHETLPPEAAALFDGEPGFAPSAAGFASRTSRLDVDLPSDGARPIRFRIHGAPLAFEVREIGGGGDATTAGRTIAYANPRWTSHWVTTANGVEEWLHVDVGATTQGEAPL